MAFAATTVFEIRQNATANNVNGGTWNTAGTGTDYSQQTTAQYNLTGGTSVGSGSTILHASASADMVGNGLYIVSGTNATVNWYQIINVSAGVSITLDKACTTGVGASIVFNIGGAWSMQTSTDSVPLALVVPGNTIWIKAGAYNVTGGYWNCGSAGTLTNAISITGYNTTRGDNPTGTNRPHVLFASNDTCFLVPAYWIISNISFKAPMSNSGYAAVGGGQGNIVIFNCKVVNYSTTASAGAALGASSAYINSEFVCYRGEAINIGASSVIIQNCYCHDSVNGVYINYAGGFETYDIVNCIFDSNTGAAIVMTGNDPTNLLVMNCTLYGAENKLGRGIDGSLITTASRAVAFNNIFYGFTTGFYYGNPNGGNLENYNDYYNNTTDVNGITKGPNDLALNPVFAGVAQITGTNGTTSGFVLTSSGANFSSVTDGQDCVYIVSGTGITTGVYGILSHTTTTLTLDIAPGNSATADKVFQITTGHNFAIGTNLKAAGLGTGDPYSIAYVDLGAVQRQESSPGYSRGRAVNI